MVGSSPDFATMSVDVAVPYAKQEFKRYSDKKCCRSNKLEKAKSEKPLENTQQE